MTTGASPDPTAVIGRRIVAFLISLLIVGGAAAIGVAVADLKREDTSTLPPSVRSMLDAQDMTVCDLIERENDISVCFEGNDTVFYSTEARAALAIFGLPVAVSFLNSVVLASIAGGSIGKLIVGLRVVKASTGARAGLPAHLLRWLLWAVDGFFYCVPVVGLVTGLAVKGHRRVGDLVAGTVVVPTSALGRPPTYPGSAAALATASAPWSAPPGAGSWAPPAPSTPDSWAPPVPSTPESWAPPAPGPTGSDIGVPTPDPWSAPPASPAADPWTVPAPDPSAAPDPIDAAKAAPSTPQWDPARREYVLWEPATQRVLRYDDATQEWQPRT